jgi:hypothetical protein
MAEKRFSEVLTDVGTALAAAEKTVQKQVRAAADAAAPKWEKSGKLEDLKGFFAAFPGSVGADLSVALSEEIALRGREWAREHFFTACSEWMKGPLQGVGAEA